MERDDIIEYSLDSHHSEEAGKKIRKNIYKVTIILSLITFIEVVVGIQFSKVAVGDSVMLWNSIKLFYVILTIVKAAYIVLVFMHLGDERKNFRWFILAPYVLFISYLLFIVLKEGVASIPM